MKPEQILSHPPKVLSQEQRESYFENGYLLLEKFVQDAWLERLWQVTNEFIEESRSWTASGSKFDLEPGHGPETGSWSVMSEEATALFFDPREWAGGQMGYEARRGR